jgi:5-methylcytosine-specific restriction endonuclease McrA
VGRKKKRRRKIVITHPDGEVEVITAGEFDRRLRQKRREKKNGEQPENLTRYHRYLRSDEWKDRRKRILIRDNHTCQDCGSHEHLQVHHLTYERIYRELAADLVTLCRPCHCKHHRAEDPHGPHN